MSGSSAGQGVGGPGGSQVDRPAYWGSTPVPVSPQSVTLLNMEKLGIFERRKHINKLTHVLPLSEPISDERPLLGETSNALLDLGFLAPDAVKRGARRRVLRGVTTHRLYVMILHAVELSIDKALSHSLKQ